MQEFCTPDDTIDREDQGARRPRTRAPAFIYFPSLERAKLTKPLRLRRQ